MVDKCTYEAVLGNSALKPTEYTMKDEMLLHKAWVPAPGLTFFI